MVSPSLGTRFLDYQQYVDLADGALAAFGSPLMNGLPMARVARQLIANKRLFFLKQKDHVLIFSAHDRYFKLYYAAQEDAALAVPATPFPIVTDQVRLQDKQYPQYDALMERSSFTLGRVNVGMERKLNDTLKQELYLSGGMPGNVTVGLAMPGEFFRVDKLLRNVFNAVLDELPSKEELREILRDGHVFAIRDHERIAAAMVRISKGATAMLHWIAVDENYRNQKLSGMIHLAGDEDSMRRGYHQVVIWINDKAQGWIEAVKRRGYADSKQRLFTYVYHPQKRT